MNRRSFLKALGAAIAAISAPQIALATARARDLVQPRDYVGIVHPDNEKQLVSEVWLKFNPAHEYGKAIRFPALMAKRKKFKLHDWVRDELLADARKYIPPGNVVEIVGVDSMDFGRIHGAAWRYTPAIQTKPPALGIDRQRGVEVVGVVRL